MHVIGSGVTESIFQGEMTLLIPSWEQLTFVCARIGNQLPAQYQMMTWEYGISTIIAKCRGRFNGLKYNDKKSRFDHSSWKIFARKRMVSMSCSLHPVLLDFFVEHGALCQEFPLYHPPHLQQYRILYSCGKEYNSNIIEL